LRTLPALGTFAVGGSTRRRYRALEQLIGAFLVFTTWLMSAGVGAGELIPSLKDVQR